jgi:xanthine dehydrogenase accessory factor
MLELAANYANYVNSSMHWAVQLADLLGRERCVLVTLDLIVGSAPRESGCRMIVTADDALGSIGGGSLEFEATAYARELLAQSGSPLQEHRPYALGPALNQCCGGAVTLLFERFEAGVPPSWLLALADGAASQREMVLASAIDRAEPFKSLITQAAGGDRSVPEEVTARGRELLQGVSEAGIETLETAEGTWWLELISTQQNPLVLFGAGHVGQAVARYLEDLPFNVKWVDGRPGVFPDRLRSNIKPIQSDDALAEVSKAPRGSIFVVMTHSHQLDEDICFEVLSRGDFAWLGLIGSVTKRRRFVQRLAKRGISESDLARLVCPVGLGGIKGKQPATIALSLVAQLMHTPESDTEVVKAGGGE